jgi:hypothetical protein
MLNIRGVKVYTQDEILENLATGIRQHTDENDWQEHIDTASSYIADAIEESDLYVNKYLSVKLGLKRP